MTFTACDYPLGYYLAMTQNKKTNTSSKTQKTTAKKAAVKKAAPKTAKQTTGAVKKSAPRKKKTAEAAIDAVSSVVDRDELISDATDSFVDREKLAELAKKIDEVVDETKAVVSETVKNAEKKVSWFKRLFAKK